MSKININDLPVSYHSLDGDGKIKEVNSHWLKLLGYDRQEVIGKPISGFLTTDSYKMLMRQFSSFAEKGRVENLQLEFVSKTRQVVHVEMDSHFITGENGKLIESHCLLRNVSEKYLIEQQKEEEKQRIDALLNNLPGYVYLKDEEYNIIYSNETFNKLFGMPDGRKCYQVIHGTGEPCGICPINEVFKTGKPAFWEWKDKQGRTFMIYDYIFPTQDNSTVVLELGIDITRQKKAETALQERESLIKTIQDTNPNPIYYKDIEGKFIGCNKAFARLYNLDDSDIRGATFYDLLPKESAKIMHHSDILLMKNRHQQAYDTTINIPGKKPVEVIFYKACLYDDNKKVSGMIGVMVDITDRKNAEAELKKSETKFKNIFNKSSNMVFIVDLEGNILEVNDTACHTLGYTVDELLNLKPEKISVITKSEGLEKRIDELLQSEQFIFGNYLISKKGQSIPVETTTSMIDYEDQKAFIVMVRDISEKKNFQTRLLRTVLETEEKERQRFARDLHDGTGAILSSISLYLDLLKDESMDPGERQNMIEYSIGLVKDAIDSTREIAYDMQPNSISRFGLVATLKSYLEKLNKADTIAVEYSIQNIPEDLSSNMEVSIYRVTQELISNTLKHSGARKILFDFYKRGSYLYIRYQDDGIGFDISRALSSPTGSGLANMKSRIESNQGVMDIQTEPGQGFVVEIKIEIQENG